MINVIQNGEIYEITFPYDASIVEIIKQIPGRRWNPDAKMWTIPKERLGFLINEFKGTVYEPIVKIRSDEDINQNEDLSTTTAIPNIDISNVSFYVKGGSKPYEHQLDFMKWAIYRQNQGNMHGFILADEMGCISGDAIVHVNFRKAYQKMTLRELYRHWISHPQYHDGESYKVRCLRDNVFRLNAVEDILFSGEQDVYLLELSNGYSVEATHDHEILTTSGYVKLSDLKVGDNVVTNGVHRCKNCGSSENIISYNYSKFKGYCKRCMYKLRYNPKHTEYIELKDNDGYILCRGSAIPDWHGFTWQRYIYKHRLIMENHIGRRLQKDEVVHHKNGIRDDNRLENLELTNIHDHHRIQHDETYKLYSKDYVSKWGNEVVVEPRTEEVVSISYVGKKDTYDIKMKAPYHNFIANGIVVHNCGKSVESTNLAIYNRSRYTFKHCLIICCINSSKYHWQDDISQHTDGEYEPYILGSRLRRNGTVRGDTGSKEKYEDLLSMRMYNEVVADPLPYFLIVNVEALRYKVGRKYVLSERIVELINSGEINMIILDEVHKNIAPTSQQGKQILAIKKATGDNGMWIPMTGTPITKEPIDVYTPLKLCNGHDFNSYYKWCQQFCIYGGFGGYEVIGYKNIPYLKNMLEVNMIRRTKDEVLDLPPKIRYTEFVENTEYQRKLYEKVIADLKSQEDDIKMSLNPMARFLRLRQVNGSPELVDTNLSIDDPSYLKKNAKLQRLMELLADIHERGEKVVVFSNWVEPLRTLYKFVTQKYKTCVFTGTMSTEDREKHKKTFQNNPAYTILLGTIGAAGTTQTFTAARNVIFFDDPWNPSDKAQAEDRIYRIGTTQSVNIFTLVSKDTVDDKVEQILYRKTGVAKYIVDGKLDLRNNPELFDYLLGDKS